MKHKIKAYYLYGSLLYRILVIWLFPILAMALQILTYMFTEDMELIQQELPVLSTIFLSLLVMLECMADYWFLSGSHGKKYGGVGIVQSSVYGRTYMKSVMMGHILRQYISYAIVAFVPLVYVCHRVNVVLAKDYIALTFTSYFAAIFVTHLVTLISRYIGNMTVVILVAYIGTLIDTGLIAVQYMGMRTGAHWMYVVYPLAALVASVGLGLVGCKKMEGTYYDEGL